MQVPIPDDEVHVDPRKGRNIEELVPYSRSHSRRLSSPVVFSQARALCLVLDRYGFGTIRKVIYGRIDEQKRRKGCYI